MTTCWVAWAPEEWDSGIRVVASTKEKAVQALKDRYDTDQYKEHYWSKIKNDSIYDYIEMLVIGQNGETVERFDILEYPFYV